MPPELEAYTCRKVYRGFRATYTPMQAMSLLFKIYINVHPYVYIYLYHISRS